MNTRGIVALVALQLAVLLAHAQAAYQNPHRHESSYRLRDPRAVSPVVQSHNQP